MFSLLPAAVSLLFLGYGIYVLTVKGFTRLTVTFFGLCVTTFFWQFSWAVLFQVRDPDLAGVIVRLGYLFILFLPVAYYHFIVEVTRRRTERPLVRVNYVLAALLAATLPVPGWLLDGYYSYFWGYYPRAGGLHFLHLLQTGIIALRCLYIAWRAQRVAPPEQRARLQFCLLGLAIYTLAALDYLCNYGLELYPPGAVFLAVSLGVMVVAVTRYDLLANPLNLAASMAHEIRTPLATIRAQALAVSRYFPILFDGYQRAVEHQLCEPRLRRRELAVLERIGDSIELEVDRSTVIVDLMLAASRMEMLDRGSFRPHGMRRCVDEAVASFPCNAAERAGIRVVPGPDFQYFGSDFLMTCVLYNLLKNALHAIKAAGKGEVSIALETGAQGNRLSFTDTGTGIPEALLEDVFEPFFTTKRAGSGTGIGLAFCRRVMTAFGGRIRLESEEGRYTRFTLDFPPLPQGVGTPTAVTSPATG